MRQCNIYSCRRYPGRRCCADCEDRTCLERCENHPDRCRCWRDDSELRVNPRQVTPEEEAEILQLLRDKSLSIPEIVSRSGRSESVVQRIARENGIRRKTGHARKYSWEEIARLKAEGLGSEVIAERMGCSVNTVKHVLRRIGGGHDGGN